MNNGVLGVFDPTLLPNGHYTLLLTVETANASISRELTISVEGELKVGNFSMSFVDMDIPVYGFPLSVTRTYDSRVKDVKGNFSFGWDMKLSKATLSENGVPGDNWRLDVTSGWLKTYTLVEEKPHEVVIDWGNGKTDKFALKINPTSQAVYPLKWVQASYVTTNDSKSRLKPLGQSTDLLIQHGQIYDYDFRPYNPKQYKLTALDGTVYVFDDVSGLERVTSANGDVVTITKNGVTHSDGKSIIFERDAQNRITKISGPTGHFVSYLYDEREDLVSVTDIGGHETQFSYDDEHFLTDITDPRSVKVARNEYDIDGRLVATIDANGNYIMYDHDVDGRRMEVTDRLGNTTLYIYDGRGNILSLTDANGHTTTHTYDANGRLATTTDALNLTKVAYSNGMTTAYTYNAVNALIKERIMDKTNTLIREYVYTVGDAGERLQVQESNNRAVTYTYDALYRLTGETVTENAATTSTTYAYDSVSNRVSKNVDGVVTSYTYNNLNQLTSETGITYQYDQNGNRTKKIEGARTTTYTFDGFNRLSRATIQEGANVAVEEYGYDWRGNRVKKSRELDTVKYLVDTNNWISHVVAETDGTGALKAFYTRGGDTLISMNRGGVKSYYLFDGHGSVRMLANEANFITDTWNFDAYGEITFSTGVTENDYLYAGERFDRTTELYHLRARYMDPKTGTFMSMDTYQGNMHDPMSLHKYMYANANPISNTDPTGLTSYTDMLTALSINGVLHGVNGLNYAYLLQMLVQTAYAVNFTFSITNLVTSMLTGNLA